MAQKLAPKGLKMGLEIDLPTRSLWSGLLRGGPGRVNWSWLMGNGSPVLNTPWRVFTIYRVIFSWDRLFRPYLTTILFSLSRKFLHFLRGHIYNFEATATHSTKIMLRWEVAATHLPAISHPVNPLAHPEK